MKLAKAQRKFPEETKQFHHVNSFSANAAFNRKSDGSWKLCGAELTFRFFPETFSVLFASFHPKPTDRPATPQIRQYNEPSKIAKSYSNSKRLPYAAF